MTESSLSLKFMIDSTKHTGVIRYRRRLRRFFSSLPLPAKEEETIQLSSEETRHLRQTLRLGKGDRCLVIDAATRQAEARIEGFTKDKRAILHLEKFIRGETSPNSFPLTVCVGIPQKSKMEFILEKAQELGIDRIVPVETEHTVVRIPEDKKKKVMDRWDRILREAAKQSGSLCATKVLPICPLDQVLKDSHSPTLLVFHPGDQSLPFKAWLKEIDRNPGKGALPICCFIGPEGGFSEKEVEFLESKGGRRIALGKNILKVDTAFMAVAAIMEIVRPCPHQK